MSSSLKIVVLPAQLTGIRHTVPGLNTANVMEMILEELDQEPGLR
jgi:hypothetical protein